MLGRAVIDLLLPPRCPGCGATTTSVWCGRCLVELNQLALPLDQVDELDDGVRAVGAYAYAGVVRDSLVAAKVRGHREQLAGMRALLWSRLGLMGVGTSTGTRPGVSTAVGTGAGPGLGTTVGTGAGRDAGQHAGITTTWVPTTSSALRDRGVCVPSALAGPHAVPLLRAVRRDADQTSLSARGRRRSKRGAFAPIAPVPRAVVLVDDVRTTGATARAAAAALRRAGAARVLVVTFAVGGDAAREAAAREADRRQVTRREPTGPEAGGHVARRDAAG